MPGPTRPAAPRYPRAQPDGPRGQPDSPSAVVRPIPSVGAKAVGNCSGCEYGAARSNYSGGHRGVDVVCDVGSVLVAAFDCEIATVDKSWYTGSGSRTGKAMVSITPTKPEETGLPARSYLGYGHMLPSSVRVQKGQKVPAGTPLGRTGSLGGSQHIHMFISKPGSARYGPGGNGNTDPTSWVKGAQNGEVVQLGDTAPSSTDADVDTASLEQIIGTAKAAAFATFIDLPGIMEMAESLALRGEKSLMNDQPLLPFVQQLCKASLRSFQSLPNGGFFAFYPDYFGGLNHRTPYWEIEDIEIIDANMQLTDDSLATHVYVVGDIANFDGVNLIDKIQTAGVISVFEAFQSNFISDNFSPAGQVALKDDTGNDESIETEDGNPPSAQAKAAVDETLAFLRKYGARPYFEEAPMVRSPYFEVFLAYQTFMLMWSRQFVTGFTFTYMPELYPGGIVSFPSHGIQCYIDSVEHIADMEQGFMTKAQLSAPAAINSGDGNRVGRLKAHEGMIRAGSMRLQGSEE